MPSKLRGRPNAYSGSLLGRVSKYTRRRRTGERGTVWSPMASSARHGELLSELRRPERDQASTRSLRCPEVRLLAAPLEARSAGSRQRGSGAVLGPSQRRSSRVSTKNPPIKLLPRPPELARGPAGSLVGTPAPAPLSRVSPRDRCSSEIQAQSPAQPELRLSAPALESSTVTSVGWTQTGHITGQRADLVLLLEECHCGWIWVLG